MPLISALKRQKQMDLWINEASLAHIERPCLKINKIFFKKKSCATSESDISHLICKRKQTFKEGKQFIIINPLVFKKMKAILQNSGISEIFRYQ